MGPVGFLSQFLIQTFVTTFHVNSQEGKLSWGLQPGSPFFACPVAPPSPLFSRWQEGVNFGERLSAFQLPWPGAGPAEAGTFISVSSPLNSLGLSWIKGLYCCWGGRRYLRNCWLNLPNNSHMGSQIGGLLNMSTVLPPHMPLLA